MFGINLSFSPKNIELVLTEYIKLVHEVFPEYSDDTQVSCVLLNNIQQARIQLEKLYNMMGGVNVATLNFSNIYIHI